ncbi:MAG: O-antigen/teichoic acid export membrane protein [Vicingaceae bacterium]|jgi:O-antigen/teichoic acid export membrane protein
MSLKSKVLEGIKWRGIVDISQQLLQILFTIILARLLTKADFGMVAMALLVNRFVVSITNIGFGTAIIQSQTVNKGQISAIFYIQFGINVLLCSLVYLGADIAARFFDEPGLVPIIQAISFVIFLQTFQFPNILLKKNMDFKSFSISEMISMVSSNIIAIVLAFMGYGVWALVWRLLMQRTIFGALSFLYGKWFPTKPEFQGIKPLFKFGLNMLGSNIIHYFAENMIGILTGKLLGKEVLGLFNIAYNLAIKPSTQIQSILSSVLTAGFSKIQFNIETFRRNNMNVMRITSLFFLPFMIMLSATSTNLIVTFYGEKWGEAGNMLLFLSFVGVFRGLSHLMRNAIISVGNSRAIFYATIIEIISSLPLMYFLMPYYGIYGLMVGYFIGALGGWLYLSKKYNESISNPHGVLKAISFSVINSAILFAVVYSLNLLEFSAIVTLVLQMVSGTLLFVLILWFFNREELMLIVDNFRKKLKFRRNNK